MKVVRIINLYSHMYFAGLLVALILDALTYLFFSKVKQNNRFTILFLFAIVLFIISILIGTTIGNAIGFLSLGIYTTTLLLALFGIHSPWKKYVYYFICLIVSKPVFK